MEPWSNAAEFEAVAARAVESNRVGTRDGVTSFDPFNISVPSVMGVSVHTASSVPSGMVYMDVKNNRLIVGEDTARQIRFEPDPVPGAEKQEKHMSQRNNKVFEVVFEDGAPTELIPAQSVSETEGRISFLGFVEGVDDSYGSTTIRSIKADAVKSFRVVPKPETDAKTVGKNVYRVNHADGTSKDVHADHVLFQAGSGDKPGRYSLVTSVRGTDNRTEYIVPEDNVASVERVTEDGETTVLVGDKADATA